MCPSAVHRLCDHCRSLVIDDLRPNSMTAWQCDCDESSPPEFQALLTMAFRACAASSITTICLRQLAHRDPGRGQGLPCWRQR